MRRAALLVLPAIAVAVVAFALLVVGAERACFGARVYGGPTDGVSVLAFRLAVVERFAELEAPVALARVNLELTLGDGRRLEFRGPLDENGMATVRFDLARNPAAGPMEVVVSDGGRLSLGRGKLLLTRAEWLSGARREGGWLNGRRSGSLAIRAAVERGVLAVPFREPLLIEVRGPNGPVEGAELRLEPEGLELVNLASRSGRSDARGNLRVEVEPREHNAALRITAKAGSLIGEWYSLLPIVPGALRASLDGGRLRIESPIARELVYYSVISEQQRLAGGPVKLDAAGAIGFADLPPLPAEPLWAVVSSEAELDSAGSVGWPINAPPGEPAHTLTLADRLLLDTVPQALGRERARRNRARWLAAGFSLACLGLIATLLFARTREAQEKLEAHLARTSRGLEGAERVVERRPGLWLVVAVLCVALGFTVVLLVLLYRMG